MSRGSPAVTRPGVGEVQDQDRALMVLERVADERGERGLAAEAREARAGLAAGRFNVAVMGQFKRGKSTLINALLGRPLLPADVAPLTTAITLVEHGPAEAASVRYDDGREEPIALDDVPRFVSEEENPGNTKGVRVVRIELPLDLLASGMRLVDTPGVGSVFASNAEVTRAFLPRIDVAVVVVGSDPPISGEELALVRTVAPEVGHLFIVLNKSDRVREATRAKAEAFTRQVLREALTNEPQTFIHASARTALLDGSDPGITTLGERLERLAEEHGRGLAGASAARAARQIAAHLLHRIELEEKALRTPLAELDGRVESFAAAMRDIEDLALAAVTRIHGETVIDWNGWRETEGVFIADQVRATEEAVARGIGDGRGLRPAALRQRALEITREHATAGTTTWRDRASREFSRVQRERSKRVSGEANRLLRRVAEAAAAAFGVPVADFEPRPIEPGFERIVSEFTEPALALDVNTWLIPLLDGLSPRAVVVHRAARRGRALAAEWLRRNLHAIDERLTDALDALTAGLERGMRERLDAMRGEIDQAIGAGRRVRDEGESAVAGELARLSAQRTAIAGALALARGE
ncbi:MAG: dynamin family protein [Acidobacteriota bacterium]